VTRGVLSLLVLLALTGATPSHFHDHGGPDAGVYDDYCPSRVASLCGVGLPAGTVPPAPRLLPAADRPAAPVPTGLAAAAATSLQSRAPPPPSVA
jgi:hypothetical protein